uniref:Matrix metallopeptidase 20a (enamelysin) n=1 Tax=Scleropages formosus TaxID=113540 RepID=A0A8C9RMM8_SCLFO
GVSLPPLALCPVLPGRLWFPVTPYGTSECEQSGCLQEYLMKFYRLEGDGALRSKRDTTAMERNIQKMQDFFGLEVSGRLDPKTLEVMKRPRCGVPDVDNYSFYPDKPRWTNRTITYRIMKYTPDLSREEVESSLRRALKLWSDAAPLRFLRVDSGKADIMITFGSKAHGDFFPFDGPRGVLAHAFEPGEDIGGDVHFDEDEVWTTGNRREYDLLGHSLGLSHSKDPFALMYPNYKQLDATRYSLPKDDRLGIQALYGKKRKFQSLGNIIHSADPSLSFDAVAVVGQDIVFFKNRYKRGYVNTYLPSINSPVDAAYDIAAKGVAYIFTGPKYWVVQQLNTRSYYGSIYDFGFPLSVKQVNAAVHISEFGKTYFFVEDVYYRYDEGHYAMDPGYPRKTTTDWPGIERKIDAAFKLGGYIHFFSRSTAYIFDYTKRRVQHVTRANAWLDCWQTVQQHRAT